MAPRFFGKKTVFPHWRVKKKKRGSKIKEEKKKTEMCVGRQQEGKSGQQLIEVKATWLLGALRLAAYLLKRNAGAFGDLETS